MKKMIAIHRMFNGLENSYSTEILVNPEHIVRIMPYQRKHDDKLYCCVFMSDKEVFYTAETLDELKKILGL